jgi:hypothetical protein
MAKQTFTSGQVLTAQQMNDLQTNDFNMSVTTQTANYTLQAADKGTREVMNMGSAGTVTVPNSTFNAGDAVWLHSIGSGTISVVSGAGLTLNSSAGTAPTLAQWEGGVVYFTSASAAIFFRGGAGTVIEVEALAVGGGGAGYGNDGSYNGGGGGGGQTRTTQRITTKGTLGVIVGAGGSGTTGTGTSGTESRFFDIQAPAGSVGTSTTGGAGGIGTTATGGKGGDGTDTSASNGGNGTANDITGTSVTRGGGGGGTRGIGGFGLGGTGGGGNGGGTGGPGVNGTANTGGGGGAGDDGQRGGNGGSGVVIIRYLTAAASGLTITGTNGTSATSGSYTVWTFTSTGVLRIV